ncbi:MAG: FHA domain-containing protein, partial [Coriobacteriales bacterium]
CDADIVIGRDEACAFRYAQSLVSANHARLSLVGEAFSLEDLGSSNGTILNGEVLAPARRVALVPGDVVQILDLVFMVGQRFIVMNLPDGLDVRLVTGAAYLDHEAFAAACPPATEDTGELPLFYPAPRLSRSIHAPAIQIDEPPAPKKKDKKPAIIQLGPSFLMGITSLFMVISAVSRLMNGADVLTTVPMIAMSISMVAGMVIWPVISKRYEKRNDAAEESTRQSRYTDYLNSIESRFSQECGEQEAIYRENRVTVESLEAAASELLPSLMNRSAIHEDFLELRVGVGDAELEADVRWPTHGFKLDSDPLLGKVDALAANPPRLHDVPLAVDIADNYNAGIIGDWSEVWAFTRGLVVQLCALYSYQDLKVILIADEADQTEWDFIQPLAHVMDATGKTRYIATSREAATEVSLMIMRELDARTEQRVDVLSDYGCYYVVVCASNALAESCEAVGALAKLRANCGFSLLYLGRQVSDLPRECGYVMDLDNAVVSDEALRHDDEDGADETPRRSRMFAQNDISGTRMSFDPDIFVSVEQARRFAAHIARVHLDSPEERTALPGSVGFMEMFQVGTTAQLDIPHRWAEADASRTLAAPLGIDPQGEYALLNLHEKV